jgi:hypothetical protein
MLCYMHAYIYLIFSIYIGTVVNEVVRQGLHYPCTREVQGCSTPLHACVPTYIHMTKDFTQTQTQKIIKINDQLIQHLRIKCTYMYLCSCNKVDLRDPLC